MLLLSGTIQEGFKSYYCSHSKTFSSEKKKKKKKMKTNFFLKQFYIWRWKRSLKAFQLILITMSNGQKKKCPKHFLLNILQKLLINIYEIYNFEHSNLDKYRQIWKISRLSVLPASSQDAGSRSISIQDLLRHLKKMYSWVNVISCQTFHLKWFKLNSPMSTTTTLSGRNSKFAWIRKWIIRMQTAEMYRSFLVKQSLGLFAKHCHWSQMSWICRKNNPLTFFFFFCSGLHYIVWFVHRKRK